MFSIKVNAGIAGRLVHNLVLAVAVLGVSGPGMAVEPAWNDDNLSYDRARRAVNSGEAIPLAEAMARLREIIPGKLIATEYEYEFDRWVYEFTIIDREGRLRKVHLDAHTGALVQVTDN